MEETNNSTSDSYLTKLQNLPWSTLEDLLLFILNRIFSKTNSQVDIQSMQKQLQHVVSFFGSIFFNKHINQTKVYPHASLKFAKIFILKHTLRVAKRRGQSRNELIQKMRKYFKSLKKRLNYPMFIRKRLPVILGWFDSAFGCEALFSESFDYMLTKFGAEIQSKWLLARFAQHIASLYFRTARSNGELDLSDFDPLLSSHIRLIIALVLSTNRDLGTKTYFNPFN